VEVPLLRREGLQHSSIGAGSSAGDGGHPAENGSPATNAVTDKSISRNGGKTLNEIFFSDKLLTKAEISSETRPYRDLSQCSFSRCRRMYAREIIF
jgi:hypothetical protein